MKEIYVDGSPDRIAFVMDDRREIIDLHGFVSHNEAEYRAVHEALVQSKNMVIKDVLIRSDSMLVVMQLSKKWRINEEHLRKWAYSIWTLIKDNNMRVEFKWIRREKNMAGKLL